MAQNTTVPEVKKTHMNKGNIGPKAKSKPKAHSDGQCTEVGGGNVCVAAMTGPSSLSEPVVRFAGEGSVPESTPELVKPSETEDFEDIAVAQVSSGGAITGEKNSCHKHLAIVLGEKKPIDGCEGIFIAFGHKRPPLNVIRAICSEYGSSVFATRLAKVAWLIDNMPRIQLNDAASKTGDLIE